MSRDIFLFSQHGEGAVSTYWIQGVEALNVMKYLNAPEGPLPKPDTELSSQNVNSAEDGKP